MEERNFEMDKVFSPQEVETRLYEEWEQKGYFTPERVPGKKPFVIMMPPPNITGQLHMGHALDTMPQDVLTRYHRMLGEPTLWLPGTDHASIATEVKIVDALKAEGLTKQDLGREKFLERAWEWKEEYGGRITRQLRRLGASCDWTRERFTMDAGLNKAVVEVFVRLYEKDLIYRGDRIINWCPVCKTALSDAEVEYEEQQTSLWHIKYPGPDGRDIIVATTRPETMLGDTGVAVNPNDPRYDGLVGKTVTLPIMNREIPIVADDYVDLEFGTGAVKMTPAHDPNDFEVAMRHNLPLLRVLNDDGTMNEAAGKFAGMTRMDCRRAIVKELEELGLLVKTEPLTHNVGTCYRCHDTVEPLVSTQWFVKMKPLAEPAIDKAKSGELKFVPERFTKTYYNWMENIRDWCISRQLWWGHRIPAYYCDSCGHTVVARENPETCPKCGGAVRQDEDVLDTWFSSALWPFSTLGWPDETEDLKYFYPTSVMSSGYDIIFFWDARMIFSGLEQMGSLPFDTVLLHGLVRDEQGRKMAKSLGNGIDPLIMIDKYGCDALRFSLAMGVSPGSDIRMSEEKIESFRNFANKIWNASRFVLMNLDGEQPIDVLSIPKDQLEPSDRWILTRYQQAVRTVSQNLDALDLGLAAQKIYEFAWNEFCDWYIELCKTRLNGEDAQAKGVARAVLYHVLMGILKLLHPYMPFLTDEVYRYLPGSGPSIMIDRWPVVDETLDFVADAERMEGVMDIIRGVRNLRAEMNVQPGKRATLILGAHPGWEDTLAASENYFKRLAFTSQLELLHEGDKAPGKCASMVTPAADIFIPLGELVDIPKEVQRLNKDLQNVQREIARAEGMLKNPGFLSKAPETLVQTEKEKLETNRQVLTSLESRIKELEQLV
ncbi:valine--tRNA ligase [Eubacteriales bacterium OttesenSCG-928-N13]|nr:valine--tRNA ligase [Eubacteriales bacterium OttesenSCG-928-N13]